MILLGSSGQQNKETGTRPVLAVIQFLCNHLADRFSVNEVQDWSAFDCEAVSQCYFKLSAVQIKRLFKIQRSSQKQDRK